MTKQEEIREGILKEVCCVCVHKPTHYRQSMFEKDKAVQVYGSGCSYGYEEDSNQYCSLAYKVAKAIMNKLHSQGVVIKGKMLTFEGEPVGFEVEPLIE